MGKNDIDNHIAWGREVLFAELERVFPNPISPLRAYEHILESGICDDAARIVVWSTVDMTPGDAVELPPRSISVNV